MGITDLIFGLIVFLFSAIIHEVAHGYAATFEGDPTAEAEGRLTLDPRPHIDILGTIILPLVLLVFQSPFLIGWTKPILYNTYNFRHRRLGEAFVAAAGPLANLCIAVSFGLLFRFAPLAAFSPAFFELGNTIIFINLALAVFHLLPLPLSDGSRMIFALLPYRYHEIELSYARFALPATLLFILVLWQFVAPIVFILFGWITGLPLS